MRLGVKSRILPVTSTPDASPRDSYRDSFTLPPRWVPASQGCLKAYRREQRKQRLRLGDKWIDNDYIFKAWNGAPIRPDSLSAWFRKFVKGQDLPDVSIHSLRHTNATLMIMGGVPVRTVADRLGHAKASTTHDIYAHAIKSVDEKAAEVLSEKLRPASKPTAI
jgi:integrase